MTATLMQFDDIGITIGYPSTKQQNYLRYIYFGQVFKFYWPQSETAILAEAGFPTPI